MPKQKVDNKQAFKKFALKWKATFPPSKPFKGDLKIFNELLRKYKNKNKSTKIMVLGATAELRDLICKLDNVETTVCDVNMEMVKAMDLLRKYKSKEKIIICRWQKIPLREKYDIIIGDAPLNMLDKKDIEPVLARIAKLLNKQGCFLHRTLMFDPDKKVSAKKIAEQWEKNKLYIGDFRWFIEMYSEYSSYDRKTNVDSKRKLLDNIKKMYEKGWLSKKNYNNFSKYDDDVKMIIFEEEIWRNLFGKHFEIVKTLYPKGHLYCKDMPIHVLKNNEK